MDEFAPLGLFRSDCFSDVSDDDLDYTPVPGGDADVYRSIGGCMMAPAPVQEFGQQSSFSDAYWEPEHVKPTQFKAKAKKLEPSLDYEDDFGFDQVSIWEFRPAQPAPPQPKPVPEWVNPQSSLLSDDDAAALLTDVQAILSADQTISFQAFPEKFKIKAVSTDGALPTEFGLRLFKGDTAKVVMEFHRNGGCAFTFFGIFRKVAASLGARVRAYSGEALCLEAPPALPPVPTVEPVSALAVSALVDNLLPMIRGEYLDLQKQAFGELVAVSMEHCQSLSKHRQELVPLLLVTLQSPDEELVRCAAMILANVAAFEQAKKQQWNKPEATLVQMEDLLKLPATLLNVDTKRYTAKAMLDVLRGAASMDTSMQCRFRQMAHDTLDRGFAPRELQAF